MYRADFRFAPSQWEMGLLSNDFSHWLGASLESALMHILWDIPQFSWYLWQWFRIWNYQTGWQNLKWRMKYCKSFSPSYRLTILVMKLKFSRKTRSVPWLSWCHGSLCHQAISAAMILYLYFIWGRISTSCTISMFRNTRECQYIMYFIKKHSRS